MVSLNTGVDNVDAGTLAGTAVVLVSLAALCLVGNTSKTPGGVGLLNDGIDVEHGVLLDIFDLQGLSACESFGGANVPRLS